MPIVRLEEIPVEINVYSNDDIEIGDRVIIMCECLLGETGEVISEDYMDDGAQTKRHHCHRI